MEKVLASPWQDVRYALRTFRRAPLFVCGVAGTIGIGLGFVCSAFTVVNAYLLKPYEFRDPHAIYELSWDTPSVRRNQFNLDEFLALRTESHGVFTDVAASTRFLIAQDGETTYGQLVTLNFFHMLGIQPFVGRMLRETDASKQGEGAVAVLSYDAWLARYGGDQSIVGREIRLASGRFTVIGVAQPGFNGLGDAAIGVFVPITMARDFPVSDPFAPIRPRNLTVLARLASRVSASQGRAWLGVWLKQRFVTAPVASTPATRMESRATRIPLTPVTIRLFSVTVGAFGLVLLIACANVANLMLARGLLRQREIAVRLSLGATRARIVRQLLIETALVCVPAASLALAFTYGVARVIPRVVLATWPAGLPPVAGLIAPMDPDGRVLVFLGLATVVAAGLFGLSPALQTTRTSLSRAATGEFGSTGRARGLRNALLVAQIAVCAMFLVTGAGLIGELRRLSDVRTGLDIDAVADVRVDRDYRQAFAARLAADPRIALVGATWRPPLYGPLPTLFGRPSGADTNVAIAFMVVSTEYFDVFRIPIVRGRGFTADEATAEAPVVLVSEATAARLWPSMNPIGETLDLGEGTQSAPGSRRPRQAHVRVIGITRDVTSGSIMDGVDRTCVYFPTSVAADEYMSLVARARGSIAELGEAVRDVTALVRQNAVFPVYPMRQVAGVQLWSMSALSSVVSLLALVAFLLAFSGTYAVVAYLVTQRTREFGIRMALGASASDVARAVIAHAARIGVLGGAIGGTIALGLSYLVAAIVEAVRPFGVAPLAAASAIVISASLVAAAVPSIRAGRVDPAAALRSE
jgi:putative ABC transport system permease protein